MARERSDKSVPPPPRVLIVAHGQPSDPGPAEAVLAEFAGRVAGHLEGWRVGSATLAAPGALASALADLEMGGRDHAGLAGSGTYPGWVGDAGPEGAGSKDAGPEDAGLEEPHPEEAGGCAAAGSGRSALAGPADRTGDEPPGPVSRVDIRDPDAPEGRFGEDSPDGGRFGLDADDTDAGCGGAGNLGVAGGGVAGGGAAEGDLAGEDIVGGGVATQDPPDPTPPGREREGQRPDPAPSGRLAAAAAGNKVAVAKAADAPDTSQGSGTSPTAEGQSPATAGSAFSATGGDDPQDLPPVLIFPMFMADGWFTRSELPRRLAEAGLPPARMRLLAPFGTDPAVIDLAEAVLRAAVAERGWRLAETHLLLAAHGSFRSPAPAAVARRVARVLVDRLRPASLATGFIDQAPQVAAIAGECPAPALCLPFFALAGGHVEEDLPAALASAGFPGTLLPPLGQAEEAPALVARALRSAVAAAGDRTGAGPEGAAAR